MRPAVFCTQVVVREHFLGKFCGICWTAFLLFVLWFVVRWIFVLSLLLFAFCLVIVEGPFYSLINHFVNLLQILYSLFP